jgi:hypothetical protein
MSEVQKNCDLKKMSILKLSYKTFDISQCVNYSKKLIIELFFNNLCKIALFECFIVHSYVYLLFLYQ